MPEELELLNEWQERLRLQDWTVFLESHVHPENMRAENADGCTVKYETSKIALIQTVNPELLTENGEEYISVKPFDFEEVLVHELLHLKFSLLQKSDDWDDKLYLRVMHQIIDDLAKALVETKRANLNCPDNGAGRIENK